MEYVVAIVVVPLILVASILGGVFFLVGRVLDGARAALESEGVVKASERVTITVRFKDFRSPSWISSGTRRNPGYLVLTRSHLHVLQRPQRYGVFAREDLGRFRVRVAENGSLEVATNDPPGATGRVAYRVAVPDAAAWVTALSDAGARPV